MSVLDRLVRRPRKAQIERRVDHGPAAQNEQSTRRFVLTAGLAAAAASVASTAKAAVSYVKLGANNSATLATVVTNNSLGGTGLIGIASGTAASGVRGITSNGVGVLGTASGNGYGVRGNGGYNGVYGSGGSYGVIGSAGGGYGVYGSGSTGVYASGGSGGYGVQAYGGTYGVYTAGSSYGVYAEGATGVYGSSGTGSGVYGTSSNVNAAAVLGTGGQYGVLGLAGRTAGVRGDSGYVGVWGEGRDWGFFSIATGTSGQNYGFMSETLSKTSGYAGWFKGNVQVEGTLFKNAGSFKIDHPLDPERKWLLHSFVESPDMMNVYNGNATTDGSGLAVVKLPAYFGALNRDFRYQLTVIGKMAQAVVDREISNNQFRIRTSEGRVKVSWQVTGIRQDAYAKEHPIVVELPKRREDQGTRQFLPKGTYGRLMQVRPAATTKAR